MTVHHTGDQLAYLAQISRQRARYDRQQHKADQLKEGLQQMLQEGRDMGITTYALAEAANLSQPRVQQLTTASTPQQTRRRNPMPSTSQPPPKKAPGKTPRRKKRT